MQDRTIEFKILWCDWNIYEWSFENKRQQLRFYKRRHNSGGSRKISDDFIQAIKNKEANAATDASEKDNHMAGVWIIEDEHNVTRCQSKLWSKQWMQNSAIAAEVIIMLDLVTTDVKT